MGMHRWVAVAAMGLHEAVKKEENRRVVQCAYNNILLRFCQTAPTPECGFVGDRRPGVIVYNLLDPPSIPQILIRSYSVDALRYMYPVPVLYIPVQCRGF